MSHQPDSIANLIYGFINGTLSAEQEGELQQWLQQSSGNAAYFTSVLEKIRTGELSKEYLSSNEDTIWQKISSQRPELDTSSPTIITPLRPNRWKRIAVAASVIAVISVSTWVIINKDKVEEPGSIAIASKDVLPGGDKAILTLADGRQIVLDTTRNGQMLMQSTVKVVQTEKGKLEYQYTNGDRNAAAGSMYNMISVPAGGRFKIELPDGTMVWMNARSSLKYPVAFDGVARNVELKGEGYFEVAPLLAKNSQAKVPFNVAVLSEAGIPVSTIEVKGTHFNIQAYDSETKTTLTEGKVKVIGQSGESAMLLPGQQAIQQGTSSLTVNPNADTESATAWVNGWFNFNNATIREIMDEAARWYSLRVVYEGESDKHFSLNLPRDLPISKLLQVLEMTGSIRFNINTINQTITVQR